MKALPTKSNLDVVQRAIGDALIYLNIESLVFLDTNILIWIYRLNEDSFHEFTRLLFDLSRKGELVIPNWVVHEYNSLLAITSDEIFFPFRRKLKTLDKELDSINELAKLTIDNDLARRNSYVNKREFIKELSKEIDSLRKKLRLISDKNNFKYKERRAFVEELIKNSQSAVSADQIVNLNDEFRFRMENNIPPGFKDKDKDSNRNGDIIIWKEIIENCKEREISTALFISLDLKIDWVFSPEKIIVGGKEKFNNGKKKYYFLHPWLEEEFESNIKGGKVAFSNISGVTEVLYSPDMNPIAFEDYKNLAKTVDIELNNSETNKVIEWLVVNGHKLHYLRTTVCDYQYSPEEVDIEELEKWCIKNIKQDIDFKQVNWTNVFTNLFL